MVGILVLAFHLLRRLGATTLGAIAGSSIFLVAPSAARGWIRLTMGEPLGTLLLLALCLTIVPARRLRGNHWRWVVAGVLTAGILLTKEMLAATLLLPFGLLLLTDENGRVSAPAMSRQAAQLLILFSAVGLLCLGPMLIVALSAPTSGYASMYGDATRPFRLSLAAWLSTLVPVDLIHGLPGRALKVAVALFVALVAVGWWLQILTVRPAKYHFWLLGLAVLFPLVGALIYAPWPSYQEFYALPFLAGTSILVAFALTAFERRSVPSAQIAAYGWWGVLLLVAGVGAHWQAGSAAAGQLANYRLVTRVSSMPGIDTVLVATPYRAPQKWQGAAGTLRRYAAALGVPWPSTRDTPCQC
jgi:hypothetical protein